MTAAAQPDTCIHQSPLVHPRGLSSRVPSALGCDGADQRGAHTCAAGSSVAGGFPRAGQEPAAAVSLPRGRKAQHPVLPESALAHLRAAAPVVATSVRSPTSDAAACSADKTTSTYLSPKEVRGINVARDPTRVTLERQRKLTPAVALAAPGAAVEAAAVHRACAETIHSLPASALSIVSQDAAPTPDSHTSTGFALARLQMQSGQADDTCAGASNNTSRDSLIAAVDEQSEQVKGVLAVAAVSLDDALQPHGTVTGSKRTAPAAVRHTAAKGQRRGKLPTTVPRGVIPALG